MRSAQTVMARVRALAWVGMAALVATAVPSARAQARFDFESTRSALNDRAVRPEHVRLSLDLDPAKDTFEGRAVTKVRVTRAIGSIDVHARELVAHEARLITGATKRPLNVTADEATQRWRLTPSDGRPIAAGVHRFEVRYTGRVMASGQGLFKVDYKDGAEPRRMLATQLQAIDARRVWPSFDEPLYRSTFELDVTAPEGERVVSNMPLRDRRVAAGRATHRFQPTPPMVSYLVALAVGRMTWLEDRAGKTPLRIYTREGASDQARFAMEISKSLLPYFERYFQQPFALPKLDQVALAGDLGGAMENWGLILYNEGLLLYNPQRHEPDQQRLVHSMVAHEIAHQWFGNWVSVASWDEIWLNEAFATWLAGKATQDLKPAWRVELQARRSIERVMARDATSASRAIRGPLTQEAAVFSVFDDITYNKGGAVLAMIETWVGEKAFQRGLASYMRERALKPATAGDLWHHLGRASGQPVTAVAKRWTDQTGYPLLTATQRCDGDRTVMTVSQARFSSGEALPSTAWPVPVVMAREGLHEVRLLDSPQSTWMLPGCGDGRPWRLNAGGAGFYRVEDDAATRGAWQRRFNELPPIDQLIVLSDSRALATAGRVSVPDYLSLLEAVSSARQATSTAAMEAVASQWQRWLDVMAGTKAEPMLRRVTHDLFAPVLTALGWQPAADEDRETRALRATLIDLLGRTDHAPTLAAARDRFAGALVGTDGSVHPSVRNAVLAAVMSVATEPEFEAVLAALQSSSSSRERWDLVGALGRVREPKLVQRLLEESLAERLPNDVAAALASVPGQSPAFAEASYAHTLANWPKLATRAGDGGFGGKFWLLPNAAGRSNDPSLADRLVADQRRLSGDAGSSAAERVAALIRQRARERDRDADALAQALEVWASRTPTR